jgi:non-receptor tyrosine-protein kinase TYK2
MGDLMAAGDMALDLIPSVAGITPPCFNLFALFDAHTQVWLPPNHILDVSRDTGLMLYFRMRWV